MPVAATVPQVGSGLPGEPVVDDHHVVRSRLRREVLLDPGPVAPRVTEPGDREAYGPTRTPFQNATRPRIDAAASFGSG